MKLLVRMTNNKVTFNYITALGELPDLLNLAPEIEIPILKSNKYLWIAVFVVIAIFALLWYLASKDKNKDRDYN